MLTLIRTLACIIPLILAGVALASPTQSVIHRFGPGHGTGPGGALLAGPDGSLYGVTRGGGVGDGGTVYRMTPPASGQTSWTHTVLYTFGNVNTPNSTGGPGGPLLADADGALYGTFNVYYTASGASRGVIFRLSPPARSGMPWVKNDLATFDSGNAAGNGTNIQGMVLDSRRQIHATTSDGGPLGRGTIFQLAPPPGGGAPWRYTRLHNFVDAEGTFPNTGLLLRGAYAATTLYGTTILHGQHESGTAYRLSKPASGSGAWNFEVLHQFEGFSDHGAPVGGLISDSKLNMYGVTNDGGQGIAFRLSPPGTGQNGWPLESLHYFPSSGSGVSPAYSMVQHAGRLYGTTASGGGGPCFCGSIFALTPRDYGGHATPWNEAEVAVFHGSDGAVPAGPLIGNQVNGVWSLFGVTRLGGNANYDPGQGPYGDGVLYMVTP